MLKAAHVLAVDSKNLFDVIDQIRSRQSWYSVTNGNIIYRADSQAYS
jgi:hypothetical protein